MVNLIKKIKKDYKKFSKNSIIRSKYFDLDESCKKFWDSIYA